MLHLKTKKLLKKSSLAITKNRLKVLSFFLKSDKPISLKAINFEFKNFDRVTLFRILDNGKKLFALCKNECSNSSRHNHNHVHFVCKKCEDVSCLDIENFPVLNAPNFTFSEISINASGICSNCN